MNWRDFFYFSKGERRALTVLTGLMAIAWLVLLLTEAPAFSSGPDASPDKPSVTSRTVKKRKGQTDPSETSRAVSRRSADSQTRQSGSSSTTSGRATSLAASSPCRSVAPVIPGRRSVRSSPATPSAGPASSAIPASSARYPRIEKFPPGTVVELNTADTVALKKVPGIGSAFAARIVKYRHLLGGFYTVEQLSEVYGIDEERYQRLHSWFRVDTACLRPIRINRLRQDSLIRHPYLSYPQIRVLKQQLRQKGRLAGWHTLLLLEEFTEYDRERLGPYFSFE